MKKIFLGLTILMAALSSVVQAQTGLYNFPGHKIWNNNDGVYYVYTNGSVQTITNKNTLYLVNVGAYESGNPYCFLSQAGHWGVEAVLAEVGIPVYLEYMTYSGSSIKARLLISPDKTVTAHNHISYISEGVGQDEDGIIIDRQEQGEEAKANVVSNSGWWFEEADAAKKEYYIRTDRKYNYSYPLYVVKNPGATGVRANVLSMQQGKPSDKYGRWKFVSKEDLINRFGVTPSSYKDVADATFYIYDQHFARNNGNEGKWTKTNGTGTVNIGNAKYGAGTTSKNYTVGTNPTIDHLYTTIADGKITYYDLVYGQFNNAEIKGGTGSIGQRVKNVARGGWYMVTCQGFYRPGDGSDAQNAYLYAKNPSTGLSDNSSEWKKVKLPLINSEAGDEPQDLTQAGIKFSQNRENYAVKAMVWLPAGADLELGVALDNSTGNSGEWVAVDNFQLKYMGSDFLVSEHAKDNAFYTHFGSATFQTMVLERNFVLNQWNALTLPVTLNKDQVTTAFGNEVKLARLAGLTDNAMNIHFESVNLNSLGWEDTAIEKNEVYLILPKNEGLAEYMSWPVEGFTEPLTGPGDPSKNYNTKSPLYIVPMVSFNRTDISEAVLNFSAPNGKTFAAHLVHYWKGGYDDGDGKVTPASTEFVYAMGGGQLAHYKNSFRMKGLRWWLRFTEPLGSGAKMVFDNEENGNTTGLNTMDSDAPEEMPHKGIYSIDGRKIKGRDTKALPAGIYIVDGKKVAVY
ncbi:MAG: hypothetical protein MR681_07355 [Prevotella sp.]|nr:hypothetical protein [Prevotella sp.]